MPSPTSPTAPRPGTCRHCHQPLDRLTQLRRLDICGAAACRQRSEHQQRLQLRQAAAEAAVRDVVAQAGSAWQGPLPAIVWLQAHDHRLCAVTPDERQTHGAALQAAAAQHTHNGRVHRTGVDREQADTAAAAGAGAAPQAGRLCAQCAGRCCRYGAQADAFIDGRLLQRTQQDLPGSSIDDVIALYLQALPAAHVQGSCLYHTAQGCNVPRALRADACNDYACDALRTLRQLAEQAPMPQAVVAVTLRDERVETPLLIAPPPR